MPTCENVAPLEAFHLCRMGLSSADWRALPARQKQRELLKLSMADRIIMTPDVVRQNIARIDAYTAPAGALDSRSEPVAETCALPTPSTATDNATESTRLSVAPPTPGTVLATQVSGTPTRTPLMAFLIPAALGGLAVYAIMRYQAQSRGR